LAAGGAGVDVASTVAGAAAVGAGTIARGFDRCRKSIAPVAPITRTPRAAPTMSARDSGARFGTGAPKERRNELASDFVRRSDAGRWS
jgi:hypothetical protein